MNKKRLKKNKNDILTADILLAHSVVFSTDAFSIEKQVKKLDHEIEELYNYVTLQEENRTSSIMSILTWVATNALPITVIAGIFGMNNHAFTGDENGELKAWYNHFDSQFLIIIGITGLICLIIYLLLKRNGRR